MGVRFLILLDKTGSVSSNEMISSLFFLKELAGNKKIKQILEEKSEFQIFNNDIQEIDFSRWNDLFQHFTEKNQGNFSYLNALKNALKLNEGDFVILMSDFFCTKTDSETQLNEIVNELHKKEVRVIFVSYTSLVPPYIKQCNNTTLFQITDVLAVQNIINDLYIQ